MGVENQRKSISFASQELEGVILMSLFMKKSKYISCAENKTT